MKNFLLILCLFLGSHLFSQELEKMKALNPNLSFRENKGQICDQNRTARPDILFQGNTGQMTFNIRKDGISYQLYRVEKWKEMVDQRSPKGNKRKEISEQTIYRVDINWLNTNSNVSVLNDAALPGSNNYYLPSCADGALEVNSYSGITLQNIYNQINLHYYEKNGLLKYDYIIAPYANYKQIQWEVKGAVIRKASDGGIILQTALGDIKEEAPLVFQAGKQLKAKWLVKNNMLSFDIEHYDPTKELIIDPVTRVWGTYYGELGYDTGMTSCTDTLGNVYLSGYTDGSAGFATTGAHQTTFSGSYNAYLVKFDPNGVRLWGTYYGGSGISYGYSCCTDLAGNIFMAGLTTNNGAVMATVGAHQNTYGGGNSDVYLVKFNSAGVRQWGTYYGGAAYDNTYAISTDASGNLFLAGYTNGSLGTTIATPGSHQPSFGGGNNDGFLVKFDPNGIRLWGTYYGGPASNFGFGCDTDASGNIYFAGYTDSEPGNIIITSGAHQSTYGGGSCDAFLAKFDGNGTRLWGTYYGGPGTVGDDYGTGCKTDGLGNVYLFGYGPTNTGAYIATPGSHQSVYGGGVYDAFLAKFDGAGVRQWGTYYGGTGLDYSYECSTDHQGNVYLSGITDAGVGNAIATSGAVQSTNGGGYSDAYLAKFNTNGIRQWGTYYGGTDLDESLSCSTDKFGNVYLAGTTSSTNAAVHSIGAYQTVFGGGTFDAFLAKFDCAMVTPTISANNPVCVGSSLNFSTNIPTTSPNTYLWTGPGSFVSTLQNPGITNMQSVNAGTYTLNTDGGMGCSKESMITINVNSLPTVSATTANSLICKGETATLSASGASSYTWNTNQTTAVIKVNPTTETIFTVTGMSSNGCVNTATIVQKVNLCTDINLLSNYEKYSLSVYPNPSENVFTVTSGSKTSLKLINELGQHLETIELNEKNNFRFTVSNLKTGVYFLLSDLETKKIIVTK